MKSFLLIIVFLILSPLAHGALNATTQVVLEEYLHAQHFEPLHKTHASVLRLIPVQGVYATQDMQSAIFYVDFKRDVQKDYFKTRQISGGTHFEYRNGLEAGAWFFYKVSDNLRDKFIKLVQHSSRSVASDSTVTYEPPSPRSQTQEVTLAENLWSQTNQCLWSAFDQALNSVEGTYEGLKSGLHTLFTNPKQFWDSTVEAFEGIKKALPLIKQGFKRTVEILSNLKMEHVRMIMCSLFGEMSLEIALAFTGAGLAKLTAKMTLLIPKLIKIAKVLQALSHGWVTGGVEKIQSIVKATLDPQTPNRVLDWADHYGKQGKHRLALGVFDCAI